jgi:hypothetical protein
MVCAWLRGFMCCVGNCSSKYVGFYGLGGVLWICVEKVEVEKAPFVARCFGLIGFLNQKLNQILIGGFNSRFNL